MNTINRQKSIRNILLFTVIVNALAWLGPVLGGNPAEPGLGFLIWGTAPLVSALLMKVVLRDPVRLGIRPAIRGNGRAYALSLLLYPVSIALVLIAGLGFGAATLKGFSPPAFVTAMVPLAVTYFIFAIFEEVGWRGYLAPRVYALTDGLAGHIITGLIWASWHFPYLQDLWAHTSEGLLTLLPRFILGTVISSVVYGEIRLRTGSVWPAVLMHWVGNTLANTLLISFVDLTPGTAWLGSFGVEGVLMMAIFGIIGGALYRKRRSQADIRSARMAGQAVRTIK